MSDKFFKMYGIETRPMFYPITKHKQFKDIKCTTDEAEKIAKEVVVFPSHPGLTKEEQDYIIGAIKDYARELSVL
jgi:dTDP-4-amino-4,6-dideoxygalactose transaminase